MKKSIKSEITLQQYEQRFNRMDHLKRFQLLRKHGMPMEENHEALRRRKALELGLPPSTPAVAILYSIETGNSLGCACDVDISGAGDCYATMFPVNEILTDTKRFQNRVDAFSELSAESVARNYDPNKFDPVVLWRDPKNGKVYVLSGHSRFEGMRRRKEKEIPARFFDGTEAQAIQFARVDANRVANQENLVEDLKAFILMRDGDEARGIEPATKKDLSHTFKNKHSKLEAWSFLNPNGLFIQALQQDNLSAYPHIERNAQWVGQLRKDYPEMSNTHEEDCFNFFYSSEKNLRVSKDDFISEVEKRLAWDKPRLFPECDRGGCSDLKDISQRGANADSYKELNRLQEFKKLIGERLKATDRAKKIYTQEERQRLQEVGRDIDQEMQRLKRDLKVAESAPSLFGIGRAIDSFPAITIEEGDYRSDSDFIYLINSHLEAIGFNEQSEYYGFRVYAAQKKINKILHDLEALSPHIILVTPVMQLIIIPKEFFALVDSYFKQQRTEIQFQIPKKG